MIDSHELSHQPTPVRLHSGGLGQVGTPGTFSDNVTFIGASAAGALRARMVMDTWAAHVHLVDQGTGELWATASMNPAYVVRVGPAVFRYEAADLQDSIHVGAERRVRRPLEQSLQIVLDGLDLKKSRAAQLLGVPRTSLYRALKSPTGGQRSDAAAHRADFVADLVEEHQAAALMVVEESFDDLSDALRRDDFASARGLFNEARQRCAARPRRTYMDVMNDVGRVTPDARRLFADPAFAEAVELVAELSPGASTPSVDRATAFLALDDALRGSRTGESVAEEWAFLHTLTTEVREAVRQRAFSCLRIDDFTPDTWVQFVRAESARAWASYEVTSLPPVPAQAEPAEPPAERWELDLTPFRRRRADFDRRG